MQWALSALQIGVVSIVADMTTKLRSGRSTLRISLARQKAVSDWMLRS